VIRFIIKPLFILLLIIVPVFAQDVCPPSNLTVTPGVGTLNVTWENPGFYYGTHTSVRKMQITTREPLNRMSALLKSAGLRVSTNRLVGPCLIFPVCHQAKNH